MSNFLYIEAQFIPIPKLAGCEDGFAYRGKMNFGKFLAFTLPPKSSDSSPVPFPHIILPLGSSCLPI